VNFSLTQPYILQKTPSGTIKQTTVDLTKYRMYADGTLTYDQFLKNVLVDANTAYTDVANATKQAMDNFYSKYQKLALPVNGSLFGSTQVSKVPGRDVYFVDGDLNIEGFWYDYDPSKTKKTEVKGNSAVYDRPFTIFQTKGNTTIKGNLNHNMMLLTNGDIIFDGEKNCNDAQVVKGIFYTSKGEFKSKGVKELRNDKLDRPNRCIGGNLHVKGILIGNGLQNVMVDRRSELNQWFTAPGTPTQDAETRRGYIMNGAAVLIEYAPSVFTTSTMPPGAEEFTTALEVYRK